jgi:hypothetical protein
MIPDRGPEVAVRVPHARVPDDGINKMVSRDLGRPEDRKGSDDQ